jgi:SAM-dependent methyltransferase
MSAAGPAAPQASFGEQHRLTPVDRFGVWLSAQRLRREVPTFIGARVGDFGCGFDAGFVRTVLDEIDSALLIDVSIADDLKAHSKVRAIEGPLPESLVDVETGSLDIVICTSVLEHLGRPLDTIREFHRLLAPGGTCLINVPNWLGKRLLELSAFRLGLSPADSIDDHKRYYDPRDLWPLLVDAGFRPRNIRCFRHKFGLNTFAACRVDTA